MLRGVPETGLTGEPAIQGNPVLHTEPQLERRIVVVGVYKITNLITGDFYIGQSKNIYKRIYNHRYPGIHSKNFESDIQKYGWKNFKVEVIEECAESDLLEREAYYIDRLHPVYNFIVRGRTIPEDTKAKIRKKLIGLKQSPETIAKRKQSIRERHLIIPQTNESHR